VTDATTRLSPLGRRQSIALEDHVPARLVVESSPWNRGTTTGRRWPPRVAAGVVIEARPVDYREGAGAAGAAVVGCPGGPSRSALTDAPTRLAFCTSQTAKVPRVAQTPEELAEQQIREWKQRQDDQAIDRQRSQVETAKLLATFALAASATVVATALQVGNPNALDAWATYLLGVAFILAILVIFLDRRVEPNPDFVWMVLAIPSWTEVERIDKLEALSIAARRVGEVVVRRVRIVATMQVFVSTIAGAVAAASLLAPVPS
jgi:hypothetical protein